MSSFMVAALPFHPSLGIYCCKTTWSLHWHTAKPVLYTTQREGNWFSRIFIDYSDGISDCFGKTATRN